MTINDHTQELPQPNLTVPHQPSNTTAPIVENLKFPTEIVELPSKGILYDSSSPLASGKVEIKYMTTKEEDILSTTSYIKSGVVLDKLFQSMLATKFNYDDLLLGDRNAIMIAARIYGYGHMYETKITNSNGQPQYVAVDLTKIRHKEIDGTLVTPGENLLSYTLPSGNTIQFRLLTVGIQKQIEKSLEQQKKYAGKDAPEENLTTRLRYMTVSVNGQTDSGAINSFITNMRASDSRALREYIGKVQPDVDLTIEVVDEATNQPFRTEISLGLDLFWPDYKG